MLNSDLVDFFDDRVARFDLEVAKEAPRKYPAHQYKREYEENSARVELRVELGQSVATGHKDITMINCIDLVAENLLI